MNQALQAILERRSIRSYKPDMVPMELINQVVEAGTYAASAMNYQSAIIVAVTNKATRDKLARMNREIKGVDHDTFYGAPVVLVVLADKSRLNYLYDGTLVMGNLLNAAHAVGLGSCWIHRARQEFESAEGKALLKEWGIEGNYEGIGHCILGYIDGEVPAAAPRKANYVYHVD